MNDAVPRAVEAQTDSVQPERTGSVPQPPDDGPAGPAPLDVPRAPTGHPVVDAHVERLADADDLTTDGHVQVYEDVHRGLRDELTALDAGPGPAGPARHPTTTP
ncbi:hypothetical protein HTV45_32050 [Streptomyces sp. CHD11]|uniref:hypothetical protein n=1 Tax=Streptomyces sp. CHD11 TaxID=2741325 RepID=UPI001BFC1BD3|nr:hypothetical protein [Streptomyces sp. CHD11]MBT3155422.1 hypothetical protein [Streptomyces sp. CHD11]